MMRHIIKRQVFDVQLNRKLDSFRMQHLISSHYYADILPLLEAIFNEYGSSDETLVIDRLEIDMGLLSPEQLEKARWDDSFLAKLKQQLRESLGQLVSGTSIQRESPGMRSCRQWVYYMRTGHLRWNTLTIDKAWYDGVLETLATDYDAVTMLRQLLAKDQRVGERIAEQHDPVFLTRLMEILTARNQRDLPDAIEDLYLIGRRIAELSKLVPLQKRSFASQIWREVIVTAAKKAEGQTSSLLLKEILEPMIQKTRLSKKIQQEMLASLHTQTVISALTAAFVAVSSISSAMAGSPAPARPQPETPSQKDKAPLPRSEEKTKTPGRRKKSSPEEETVSKPPVPGESLTTAAPKDRPATHPDMTPPVPQLHKPEIPMEAAPARKNSDLPQKTDPAPVAKPTDQPAPDTNAPRPDMEKLERRIPPSLQQQVPEEGIFMLNAGIVLTHPFIGHLFRRLALLEGKDFVDEAARTKAVFLLHYLATGKTRADEYELVIYKVLCSLPLDEPVPAEIEFTEEETSEAETMLSAMIQQWNKLGSTSVAGLREGFLQRSGKLYVKGDTPYVQVESHAIDVLLDYLPWNLSLIRLPWMKGLLRVEWR